MLERKCNEHIHKENSECIWSSTQVNHLTAWEKKCIKCNDLEKARVEYILKSTFALNNALDP